MTVFPLANGVQAKPKRGAKLLRSCPLSVWSLSARAIRSIELSIALKPVCWTFLGRMNPGLMSSVEVNREKSKLAIRPFFSVGQANQSQRSPRLRVNFLPAFHSCDRYQLR